MFGGLTLFWTHCRYSWPEDRHICWLYNTSVAMNDLASLVRLLHKQKWSVSHSLEAPGHGFYGWIAKRSLQKQCNFYEILGDISSSVSTSNFRGNRPPKSPPVPGRTGCSNAVTRRHGRHLPSTNCSMFMCLLMSRGCAASATCTASHTITAICCSYLLWKIVQVQVKWSANNVRKIIRTQKNDQIRHVVTCELATMRNTNTNMWQFIMYWNNIYLLFIIYLLFFIYYLFIYHLFIICLLFI